MSKKIVNKPGNDPTKLEVTVPLAELISLAFYIVEDGKRLKPTSDKISDGIKRQAQVMLYKNAPQLAKEDFVGTTVAVPEDVDVTVTFHRGPA